MDSERIECACRTCRSYCENIPGWFVPDEVRTLAASRGVTLAELCVTSLVVDYWASGEHPVFVMRPATVGEDTGREADMVPPKAPCVNYAADGRCVIHAAKPTECAAAHHDKSHAAAMDTRERVRDAWDTPDGRSLIREALGRDPKQPEPSLADAFGLMFRGLR